MGDKCKYGKSDGLCGSNFEARIAAIKMCLTHERPALLCELDKVKKRNAKLRHDFDLLTLRIMKDAETYKTLWMDAAKKLADGKPEKPDLVRDQANSAQGAYDALSDILKWCEQSKIGRDR